jgi:hypothetical protein
MQRSVDTSCEIYCISKMVSIRIYTSTMGNKKTARNQQSSHGETPLLLFYRKKNPHGRSPVDSSPRQDTASAPIASHHSSRRPTVGRVAVRHPRPPTGPCCASALAHCQKRIASQLVRWLHVLLLCLACELFEGGKKVRWAVGMYGIVVFAV